MAKKYLLYIHDERFDNEEHKSKLVNGLLDRHYERPSKIKQEVGSGIQLNISKVIKTAQDVPKTLCPHGNKYGACLEVKCLTAHRMRVRYGRLL